MTTRTYETVWTNIDTKGPDGIVRKPKLPEGIASYRVIKDDGVNLVVVADMDDTQHTDALKAAETKLLAERDILAGKKTDTAEAATLIADAKDAKQIGDAPVEADPVVDVKPGK